MPCRASCLLVPLEGEEEEEGRTCPCLINQSISPSPTHLATRHDTTRHDRAVTLVMMLLGRSIFQKYGWGVAALITPITLLATGVAFFSLIIFNGAHGAVRATGDQAHLTHGRGHPACTTHSFTHSPGFFSPVTAALGMTPLMLAVIIGAAQNVLSKSSKYSLFDPCKEMAYIPLDAEQKTKGKAAIDVIGNPLGKSGGSFIQQILILVLGSLSASTPYLAGFIFLIVGGAWRTGQTEGLSDGRRVIQSRKGGGGAFRIDAQPTATAYPDAQSSPLHFSPQNTQPGSMRRAH